MAVIGIDLGTTYSAAARCVNGVPEVIPLDGHPTLPSVVSLLKSGKIVVGLTAKRNQANAPQNTIIEAKRKMGTATEISLGEKKFSPQEISAMILSTIKQLAEDQLGEPITGVVISCPAYFRDPARAATQQAGELAGLKVLRIINEPTAAAYAYGVRRADSDEEHIYVVYDLGGGTFDVTVIRMAAGELVVLGTGGDPQLGGGNFDDKIVDWMLEKIEAKNPGYMSTLTDEKRAALRLRLKVSAEEGKIKLCDAASADASYRFQIATVDVFQGRPIVFNEELTRPVFEAMVRPLLENSLKWIDESLKVPREQFNYQEGHLTAILLVGGSTRIPLVREVLEKRFATTKTPVWGAERGINPDEIVAMGASIVAAEMDLDGAGPSTGTVLVDVTGHTLSVAAMDENQRKSLVPIINKETPIACAGSHRFSSRGDFQQVCRIEVYQGEGTEIVAEKVTMIGAFEISLKPTAEPTPLLVGLELNEDSILTAHATDESTGQRVSCKMDFKIDKTRMSPEEVARKKQLLEKQMQETIAQTLNPLTEQASPAGPAAARLTGTQITDPTQLMNPIMRTMYNKALNSFARVPADRQDALVNIVTAIDLAARSGDPAKVNGYLPQLSALLAGVD